MTTRAAGKSSYHHGDLRRALLDASLRLIEQHGAAGFTLRAAAREAGVTAGAPYHHFEDKEGVLAALAEESFQQFYQVLSAAGQAPAKSARERTDNMAEAYVRFAVEHPTRFRLMMGRDALQAARQRAPFPSARAAYELMREAVIFKESGRRDEKVSDQVVLLSWAAVHGLAFLAIDGHLSPAGTGWKHCGPIVRRLLRAS